MTPTILKAKSTNSTQKAGFPRTVAPMNTTRPGGRRNNLSWHPRFVAAFAKYGTIKAGCEAAGIDRHTYYDHIQKFPDFKTAVQEANDEVADEAEWEAYRRAVYGFQSIIGKDKNGAPITVTKYSDRLLILILKKRRPEVYGEMHSAPNPNRMTEEEEIQAGEETIKSITATIREAASRGMPGPTPAQG